MCYKEKHRRFYSCYKEIVLEQNTNKTKYMVMSRDQNARRRHNVKIDCNSSENVEHIKYFGTTVTNQNSVQEEIKEQNAARECLLSFGKNSLFLQFAVEKYND